MLHLHTTILAELYDHTDSSRTLWNTKNLEKSFSGLSQQPLELYNCNMCDYWTPSLTAPYEINPWTWFILFSSKRLPIVCVSIEQSFNNGKS